MTARAAIAEACAEIVAGRLPDERGRALVVRAARSFCETPSRARDALFRQTAVAERDRLLAEMARRHCGAATGHRQKARRIIEILVRYEAAGWRRDRHAAIRPAYLDGTAEAFAWEALKTGAPVPKDRQLREILAASKV